MPFTGGNFTLIHPDGRRRIAISEFMHLNNNWLLLDQNAAHENGGSADLDSGGPTYWTDLGGNETLVAIVAGGDATAVAKEG